jgi:hypothetical protein
MYMFYLCVIRAYEGGSTVTSIRSPESQEGACESLKGHIAVVRTETFRIAKFINRLQTS